MSVTALDNTVEPAPASPEWLSAPEVVERYPFSRWTLDRLVHDRVLRAYLVRGTTKPRYFRVEDLDALFVAIDIPADEP